MCKNVSIGRFNKTERLVVKDSVMEEISLLNTDVLLLDFENNLRFSSADVLFKIPESLKKTE